MTSLRGQQSALNLLTAQFRLYRIWRDCFPEARYFDSGQTCAKQVPRSSRESRSFAWFKSCRLSDCYEGWLSQTPDEENLVRPGLRSA